MNIVILMTKHRKYYYVNEVQDVFDDIYYTQTECNFSFWNPVIKTRVKVWSEMSSALLLTFAGHGKKIIFLETKKNEQFRSRGEI